ncbi:MAG TPA: undecaprenyl-diphosphate phosphatase [Micromonosporaceae bacterium]
MITYPEAIVVGLLQGVSELFPVSSLGHSVLLPALIGGRWAADLSVSAPESPYLAFIVGLHVATALALVAFFWRDWVRIVRGLITSIRYRRIENADERLAWMIVIATIPVGLAGLLLEHTFRTTLGRPIPAAFFLIVNGGILYGAERLRRRAAGDDLARRRPVLVSSDGRGTVYSSRTAAAPAAVEPAASGAMLAGATHTTDAIVEPATLGPSGALRSPAVSVGPHAASRHSADGHNSLLHDEGDAVESDERLTKRSFRQTTLIGAAQILALLPGISRSGVTMAAGLLRGLSHEDAARFSFLLATPVILAAGVLKLPDLTGPLGAGIGGQVFVGSLASGIGAYVSVRWLTKYFQTRTLTPFAIYCAVAGVLSLLWLSLV